MIREGKVFRSVGVSDMKEIAEYIVRELRKFHVWLFYGEMGSGKTTLIKEIGKAIGVSRYDEQPDVFHCQ